jgi:hypothetical protein
MDVDDGHPAAGGQEEHEEHRDGGPEEIGAATGSPRRYRPARPEHEGERAGLGSQENGQDQGQQQVHYRGHNFLMG